MAWAVCGAPPRRKVSVTLVFGTTPATLTARSRGLPTFWSFSRVMTSPGLMPAFSAGLSSCTLATRAPAVSGLLPWIGRFSALAMPGVISCAVTPMKPRCTWPVFSSCDTTSFTVSEGIAKPMPIEPPPLPGDRMAVFTPTTLPSWVIKGPPELPRLIGASTWMKLSYGPSPMSRPRADTMPAVTEPPSPYGLPTAITHSPGCTSSLSPSWMKDSLADGLTLSSAMSVPASCPTTLAFSVLPSSRVTLTEVAFFTTWLLVTM